ncbi:MAG: hypothetical protein SGJ20_05080 [Planctomycetota bacterium]|nr:hypothetical protein [Planctomycetota bacterium]
MLAAVASSAYGDILVDSFDREVGLIEHRRKAGTDRDDQLDAFSKLLARNPEHPRRAEVMLKLATLFRHQPIGGKADLASAMDWYRKAAENSRSGSSVWAEAVLEQSSLLMQDKQIGEAENLALDVKKYSKDVLDRTRANEKLLSIAVDAENLRLALRYCDEIMGADIKDAATATQLRISSNQRAQLFHMYLVLTSSKLPGTKKLLDELRAKHGRMLAPLQRQIEGPNPGDGP